MSGLHHYYAILYDMCSMVGLALKRDLEAELQLRDYSLQTLDIEKPGPFLNRCLPRGCTLVGSRALVGRAASILRVHTLT